MTDERLRVTRRDLLRGAGAAALVGAVAGPATGKEPAIEGIQRIDPGAAKLTLNVNGKATAVTVEPRTTLLDALRDRAGLTGSKRICDRGACGGCTVIVDGKTVNACMMLAHDAAGHKVTTVEGLATGDKLSPIQAAFCEHDALMCGFCTPGMLMSCTALLKENKNPSDAEIRAGLAGNLCRCGTYTHIFSAVKEASK